MTTSCWSATTKSAHAIGVLLEKAHTLAEDAGAAALAGAIKMKDDLQGKKVVVVVSGANVTLDRLKEVLAAYVGG